ncbi:MAG: nuclear transport factor 2 family protein [Polyangiales bacterium]|nr:nuclear transport factor 2 family protein [Myxococcales bacterium]MCB9662391.1 nuclear transport factor 2 family protein [Sandaracinaceae bacterium]
MTETTHPAVLASMNSAKFAMAGDKQSWLSLFDDDAFLADPVGPSPFDPSGNGQRGKAAIEGFWDKAIGRSKLTIVASQRIPCANTCAAVLQVTNDLGGGKQTVVDMVGIYEVNDAGKLVSLRVHWSWDQLVAQLKAMGMM